MADVSALTKQAFEEGARNNLKAQQEAGLEMALKNLSGK